MCVCAGFQSVRVPRKIYIYIYIWLFSILNQPHFRGSANLTGRNLPPVGSCSPNRFCNLDRRASGCCRTALTWVVLSRQTVLKGYNCGAVVSDGGLFSN